MIGEDRIRALLDEILRGEQFIVTLKVDVGNRIYIELDDRTRPVSITDCIEVSRALENQLDRDEEDFALEVTSPGLDRPFKVLDQYIKNIGRSVKVKRTDGRVLKGQLLEADSDTITVETKEKRRIPGRKAKEWVTEKIEIPMEEVAETYVELEFK
ncbi:MAG: ribosome assembly cofactor RimP [Flavobacteriales bacterium]|nr:ribosome assembly cofactor RimP [Flavobacteriales bacterium]